MLLPFIGNANTTRIIWNWQNITQSLNWKADFLLSCHLSALQCFQLENFRTFLMRNFPPCHMFCILATNFVQVNLVCYLFAFRFYRITHFTLSLHFSFTKMLSKLCRRRCLTLVPRSQRQIHVRNFHSERQTSGLNLLVKPFVFTITVLFRYWLNHFFLLMICMFLRSVVLHFC